MTTAEDYRRTWYEDAMASREQEFAKLLGPTSPPDKVFMPNDENWDTTIPGFAFLRYPPVAGRPFWLYLTHGLAQPAEFADFRQGFDGGLSGFGVEFALATASEESWPFAMLELLASYTLTSSKPIVPLDRVPASDLMQEARGGHLLALREPGYLTEVRTLSGTIHVVHLVGVTAAEIKRAKAYPGAVGSQILELVLREFGIGGVTNRERASLTNHPDFERVWRECEANTTALRSNVSLEGTMSYAIWLHLAICHNSCVDKNLRVSVAL